MKKHFLIAASAMMVLASCSKTDTTVGDVTSDATPKPAMGRLCAADQVLQQQIAADPQRAVFLADLEVQTAAFAARPASARYNGTLYVPVVVNIVLPNPTIVTDAQIRSQIDVLNKDFSKTNSELTNSGVYLGGYSYGSVADCAIQYVVTNVIRKASSTASFGSNDAVKKTSQGGQDPTDPTTKLNVWVCDLGSGLLGYAQFPGGTAATDGVVIDYAAFGTSASYSMYAAYDLGRSATHEIGHWINLRHIWGDRRCGDDYVGDTPQHDGANYGCPAVGQKSACRGKPLEQWMNYMDYTDDACMYMFSGGQKTRMDATIDVARAAYFLTSAPAAVL